jgi:F0F1-type ATP synthase epsilon subunit
MRRRTANAPVPTAEDNANWTSVFTDRLKSVDPLLFFTTEIRVTWRRANTNAPASRHAAPCLARREIEKAAELCDVLRPGAAEQDITVTVQERLPLVADGVVVTDVQVRVSVDDTTRTAALHSERLRQEYQRQEERILRDHELDELARWQARAREAFLREEILANPAADRLYGLLEGTSKHWSRLGGPPTGTNLDDLVRQDTRDPAVAARTAVGDSRTAAPRLRGRPDGGRAQRAAHPPR